MVILLIVQLNYVDFLKYRVKREGDAVKRRYLLLDAQLA